MVDSFEIMVDSFGLFYNHVTWESITVEKGG